MVARRMVLVASMVRLVNAMIWPVCCFFVVISFLNVFLCSTSSLQPSSQTSAPVTTVPMETPRGLHMIVPRGLVQRERLGQPTLWKARTRLILAWNAPTREFATVLTVNACALRTTTERRVNVPSVPMIALDVESASAKSPWLNCRVRRTLLLGIPISTLDASAMMDIVARTAHRRSVPLERISLVGMEAPKDVNVLDVAFASIARVFVVALMDTMETGASTRLFSAKLCCWI